MSTSSQPKGYIARYAARLLVAGYAIIPIRKGSKRPPYDGWEKTRANPSLVKKWIAQYPGGGVGVLTKLTPLVDVDVLDKDVSAHMVAFVQDRWGPAPVRIGRAPKTGLLFRAEDTFTKVQSSRYEDEWGDIHKIEILGDGQQFVAYADHADTGKPYLWPTGFPPPVHELPVLTQEIAEEIKAEFIRIAEERGWELKKSAKSLARLSGPAPSGKIDKDDVFASDAPRVEDLSDDEIAAKLMLVPGHEDYDTWFQIGMALYHQFEGEERGLELWHEWSQGAHNYDADALDEKWPTFDAEGKGRAPVTARIILKLAKGAEAEIATETFVRIKAALQEATSAEAIKEVCDEIKKIKFGPIQRHELVSMVQSRVKALTNAALPVSLAREMTRYENPAIKDAPHWMRPWVHVAHSDTFYSKKTRAFISVTAFNHVHNRFMLTPTERLEGKSSPETYASDFALNVVQVESVHNALYMPGEDEEFTYNGQPMVNTYSDRNVPELPESLNRSARRAIEAVQKHFEHLFASERDRRVLLDGLAFIAQNPGKRLNYAYLIQGAEGDGKTLLARLMASVLGPENVKSIPAQALEEKYTSWAEGAQVLFVEEIKLHGHNRFDVLNKIKPLITNPLVGVRKMNTDFYEAPNTASYLLFTNFPDALPVDENDTRYFIMFSRWQSKEALVAFKKASPRYYTDLIEAIDQNGSALRHWLLNHEISEDFNPYERALDSAGKRQMIGYNRTEEEEAVLDIVATSPSTELTNHILNVARLTEAMGDRGVSAPYGRAMNSMLIKLGFRQLHRIRGKETGRLEWLWSKHLAKFTKDDNEPDIDAIRAWIDDDL